VGIDPLNGKDKRDFVFIAGEPVQQFKLAQKRNGDSALNPKQILGTKTIVRPLP